MVKGEYDPQWPCSACIYHPHAEIYVDKKTAQVAGIK
jgi:hypothetical protein